jgi:hypothetical protein
MLALRLLIVFAILSSPLSAQEMGALEAFGADGKLYSSGNGDCYLLSRQSYGTEDSSGFSGQIRITKTYPGGGYEVQTMDYTARCNAPFDGIVEVTVREPGKAETEMGEMVEIKSPERFPGASKKDAYNLYWAACHNQFRKFK